MSSMPLDSTHLDQKYIGFGQTAHEYPEHPTDGDTSGYSAQIETYPAQNDDYHADVDPPRPPRPARPSRQQRQNRSSSGSSSVGTPPNGQVVTSDMQGKSLVDSLLNRPAMPLPEGVQSSFPSASSSSPHEQRQRRADRSGLTLSTQQAAEVMGIDYGRLQRDRSLHDQKKSSDRRNNMINLQKVLTADLPVLATRPQPRLTREEKRALLEEAWEGYNLSYDMEPEDLARRVAKIKLIIGYDASVGQFAAAKVKREAPTYDYKVVYYVFSKIYSARISHLRKQARESSLLDTDQQRARSVYLRLRPIRSFDYQEGVREETPAQHATQAARVLNAKKAWQHFMKTRVLPWNRNINEQHLDVNQIERLSRDLTFEHYNSGKTAAFLKLYMGLFLGVNETGLYRFIYQRMKYRSAFQVAVSSEARRIRRQGRGAEAQEEEEPETYDQLFESLAMDEDAAIPMDEMVVNENEEDD